MGRVVGGVLLGLVLSLGYSFFAVLVGLPIGASGKTDRATDILFFIPSAFPLVVALVVTAVPSARGAGGGLLVGIVWGLVPITLAVGVIAVLSGIPRL